jgi:hypothetical protein
MTCVIVLMDPTNLAQVLALTLASFAPIKDIEENIFHPCMLAMVSVIAATGLMSRLANARKHARLMVLHGEPLRLTLFAHERLAQLNARNTWLKAFAPRQRELLK